MSKPLPTLHIGALERMAIEQALEQEHGNRSRAARELGIHVRTLHRKLRQYEALDDARLGRSTIR